MNFVSKTIAVSLGVVTVDCVPRLRSAGAMTRCRVRFSIVRRAHVSLPCLPTHGLTMLQSLSHVTMADQLQQTQACSVSWFAGLGLTTEPDAGLKAGNRKLTVMRGGGTIPAVLVTAIDEISRQNAERGRRHRLWHNPNVSSCRSASGFLVQDVSSRLMTLLEDTI